jgi:hypothetical protein
MGEGEVMDEQQWAELYGNLIEDVSPFILGAPIPGLTPYNGGWKLNVAPPDAQEVTPADDREQGMLQGIADTIQGAGVDYAKIRPEVDNVLDAAHALRKAADKHGLNGKQRQAITGAIHGGLSHIMGGKA